MKVASDVVQYIMNQMKTYNIYHIEREAFIYLGNPSLCPSMLVIDDDIDCTVEI